MSAPTLALDLDARLDRLLEELLTTALDRARAFGPQYRMLWTEIGRSVRGGKRFRSSLVLRTHAALGGTDEAAALPVACAFELLHTAFLVHDDLIDGDSVRRGKPNLAETMRRAALADGVPPTGAERWALAAAVLAGDLALAQAHRLFASADVAPDVRVALIDLLDETVLVSAGGELADTAYGLGVVHPSLDDALHVGESKTAMYSFRAPLRAGALLAGAAPSVVGLLDDAGRLLGRAFQMVDDLLGVFAPEHATGKSNLSDLREGKRTPLLLHARRTTAWPELAAHVGRPDLDQSTARHLRHVLARSGAPERVRVAVVDDLAAVGALAADGVLGEDLAELLGTVAAQIGTSLGDVHRWVEEAACDAG